MLVSQVVLLIGEQLSQVGCASAHIRPAATPLVRVQQVPVDVDEGFGELGDEGANRVRWRIELVFDDFEAQGKARESLGNLVNVTDHGVPSAARVSSVRSRRLAVIHVEGCHSFNLLQLLLSLLNLLVEVVDPAWDVEPSALHLCRLNLHVVDPVRRRVENEQGFKVL